MTLSLNLILPIFILMPGIAVAYRALEQAGSVVRRPALSSGSIAALALIPYISFVAHLVFAPVFSAQSIACTYISCINVPFEPNPYSTAINVIEGAQIKPIEIWVVVFWALALAVLTRIGWQRQNRLVRWLNATRYGAETRWPNETRIEFLDRLQSEQSDAYLVGEAVLKDARPNGALRYIGVVDEIRLNGDDTIASITLLEPMEIYEIENQLEERSAFDGAGVQTPFKIHGSEILGAAFHIIDESDVNEYDSQNESYPIDQTPEPQTSPLPDDSD